MLLTRSFPQSHRGVPLSHTYLSTAKASSASKARITLLYSLPLSSIVTNFHSTLKSITSGYASFDYEEAPYEVADLVKMSILVNTVKVDALCSVIHRSVVEKEGREWAKRLRSVIEKQQYEVVIQAAVGSAIIARERYAHCLIFADALADPFLSHRRVAPVRKDVTAGLCEYAGLSDSLHHGLSRARPERLLTGAACRWWRLHPEGKDASP